MTPISPVHLTTGAIDITMQTDDHFFFKLDVDGVFESSHAKEFHPHLPPDRSFTAGSEWPDRQKYPHGAKPRSNGEFNYTWTPAVEPKGLPTGSIGTIRVGSGMGNS